MDFFLSLMQRRDCDGDSRVANSTETDVIMPCVTMLDDDQAARVERKSRCRGSWNQLVRGTEHPRKKSSSLASNTRRDWTSVYTWWATASPRPSNPP